MKKALTVTLALLAITFFCYACDDQPATVGCDDVVSNGDVCTENGGPVDGVKINKDGSPATKLYYPCDLANSNRKVAATTVTGGFWEKLEDMEWLSDSIAESGYVVLAFTVENNTGLIFGWKKSHLGAINRLKEINADPQSVLYGKIDESKLQTCGHSKGGGSSLWAASILGDGLKTAIGMAPWQEPGVPYNLKNIKAATLVQAAEKDSMAVPSMTRVEYAGLPNSIPKAYFEFNGLGHAAWFQAFPKVAEQLSSNVVAWMKYYLDGDTSYESQLNADLNECVQRVSEWAK